MKDTYSIQDLLQSNNSTITADMAASILKCSPQFLRITIRNNPEKLGFPTYCSGNHVLIPRIPFIRWLGAA